MEITSTRDLGDYGERLAARYLTESGLSVVDRNWRCVRGELDIVALDEGCVVVCEVKTRTTEAFGAPFEAVGWRKARRLRALAGFWLEQRADQVEWPSGIQRSGQVRIDVVSIVRPVEGPVSVRHLKAVA